MKKFLMMAAVVAMTAITVNAQRILVVDNEGHGIPLVSVLAEGGTLIGTTDLDGVLPDVKGANRVTVTHVAYKPKQVGVTSQTDGRIVLEDLDYSLSEVVVKPKPYIYVETYYRVYVYRNDSLGYFHCGIMPNVYAPKLKKLEHGSYDQNSLDFAASMGVAISWGARAMRYAGLVHFSGVPEKESLKMRYFVTTDDSRPDLWVFSNPEGRVGQLVRMGGQVRTTLDAGKIQMYANKVKGETKQLTNREEKEYEYQYTCIGRVAEEGVESSITDFIMETDH